MKIFRMLICRIKGHKYKTNHNNPLWKGLRICQRCSNIPREDWEEFNKRWDNRK